MPIRISKIKWNERMGAAANARRWMPRLALNFFAQVGAALEANPDAEQLHRVRLAAKQMRYTLELFRGCYGPALEQRIESLRELQQVLGEINDCAVARRLVMDGSGPSPQRAKAERFLIARLHKKTQELRESWAGKLGTESEQRRWMMYLAQGVREPRNGRGSA